MAKGKMLVILMIIIASTSLVTQASTPDRLEKQDFQKESFSKTIDFMEYARAYALLNGLPEPPEDYHAYLYTNYVNTAGLQIFYAGLENITLGDPTALRIPMQSLIMHYKTSNRSRDVLLGSTFLMLLAFNESETTLYPDSPDVNDVLWASFTTGLDLTSLNTTIPALSSQTEKIPLTYSVDKLHWSWGMKYTNLTALWWRTWLDPVYPHFDNGWPIALTVYDELTFTYDLVINPGNDTATLTENHIIGRMRDLLIGPPLLWNHHNSTGRYWWGAKISNETIHDFIQNNKIKMSVVNFQTSILADHETYSSTLNGQNVTDTETPIGDTAINTYSDDGEKISTADFGAKETYKLFNYTADQTEQTYTTNRATTRTARTAGIAGNSGLFSYQIGLMRLLPLVVVHMYPALYLKARQTVTNMSRVNYFYLVGYGNYSGYRIEHDPTTTIYLSTSAAANPLSWGGIFLVLGIIAVVAIASVYLLTKRKNQRKTQQIPPPAPPPS